MVPQPSYKLSKKVRIRRGFVEVIELNLYHFGVRKTFSIESIKNEIDNKGELRKLFPFTHIVFQPLSNMFKINLACINNPAQYRVKFIGDTGHS